MLKKTYRKEAETNALMSLLQAGCISGLKQPNVL
jgi:hypothetical protein